MRWNTADWSRYDLAAAVDYALARGKVWLVRAQPGRPRHRPVAASERAAGRLRLRRVLAGMAGCPPERYRHWALWNVVGPVVTRIYGYQPMSKFGLGEDIPTALPRLEEVVPFAALLLTILTPARSLTVLPMCVPIAAAVSTDDLGRATAFARRLLHGLHQHGPSIGSTSRRAN